MKLKTCFFVNALMILAATSLHAVIMRPLTIQELSTNADLVIQGIVTNKTCLRTEEGRIYTRVDLQVTDVIKGRGVSNVLSVVHGGGSIGNDLQEVEAQVDYKLGEEVVAFLVLNQRNQPVTIGLCQGKFDVWEDKLTGGKFVCNPAHGSPPPEFNTPATTRQSLSLRQSPALLKLNDLKAQIQKATR